jgi:hypothetical protein
VSIDASKLVDALGEVVREAKAVAVLLPGATRERVAKLTNHAKETAADKLLALVSKLNR